MNANSFFNRVTNSTQDILSEFINLLETEKINYCVIGGIGMNAYCEPIVTLDFDCVIATEKIPAIRSLLKEKGFKVKKHPRTIEIKSQNSDLRIHIQLDKRYEEFLKNAKYRDMLGYKLKIADKSDLLKGKIWAYLDSERNKLKKDKDLLDIKRIVEKYSKLIEIVKMHGIEL